MVWQEKSLTGRCQSVRSILRMKGERAAMMALCIVTLSPATSNAKSHHGASSRLEQFPILPQFPLMHLECYQATDGFF